MAQDSPSSRFSSETGFFYSHSRRACLCHSGCLSDSGVFFTLHYSSGKSFCQHLIPPPTHTHLLNYFPCEILFPSQSVSLSFSLFPFLLLWVVFICPDSSVPHHQLYEMTAHILGLQQGLFTEKEQHTHSNNPLLSWFIKYYTHKHTHPLHPGLDSEIRLL